VPILGGLWRLALGERFYFKRVDYELMKERAETNLQHRIVERLQRTCKQSKHLYHIHWTTSTTGMWKCHAGGCEGGEL